MSAPVPFGVGLWGMQATRLNPVSHQALYREMVEDAMLAEELGYSQFWTTEHHFWYDGYCPTPTPALAALSAVTDQLTLATGMVLLPLHDPMRIAEAAATVDAASSGRVMLGVALGYRDVEFDGFDISRPTRAKRMDEQLEVLLQAFREGEVTYEGEYYRYDRAGLTPKPHQDALPIWVGATSKAATARAARFGLPVMFGSTLPRDTVARLIEHYRDVAAQHGNDLDPGFTQSATMWVAESAERAQDIVPRVRYLLREQLGGWRYLKDGEGKLVGFDRPEELGRAVQQALDVCIIGDPDEAAKRVTDLVDAGLTHFVARIKFDGVDRGAFLRCMRLIASEVMPRFS